jgi:acyl-coenzyme A synthetase/AMP-(fatty) acid ligase
MITGLGFPVAKSRLHTTASTAMFSMATAMQLPSAGMGLKEQYTYEQLMEEVETLASVLQEKAVKKGGVVLIYSESSII